MKETTMDDHNSEHECWECGEAIAVGADMVEVERSINDEAPCYRGTYTEDPETVRLHPGCWETLARSLRIPRIIGGRVQPPTVFYRYTSRGPNLCTCQECQSGRVVEALRGSLAGAA